MALGAHRAVEAECLGEIVCARGLVAERGGEGGAGLEDARAQRFTLDDPKCSDSPITYQSGDDGDDGVLTPGETWVFTCTATVDVDTTNTAQVDATDSLGAPVSDLDSASVNVLGAGLGVRKDAPPSAFIGDQITYTYTLYNEGDTAFPKDQITLADDKCAPVLYVAGDQDTNDRLDPGESWTYECTQVFTADLVDPATGLAINTVTVEATDPRDNTFTPSDEFAIVAAVDSGIAVVKTADTSLLAQGGGSVTYTYAVTRPRRTCGRRGHRRNIEVAQPSRTEASLCYRWTACLSSRSRWLTGFPCRPHRPSVVAETPRYTVTAYF